MWASPARSPWTSCEVILRAWPTWSYTFSTWVSSQLAQGEATLDWVRDRVPEPIVPATIRTKSGEQGWSDAPRINAHTQEENEPNNEVANLHLLKRVLHPTQQTVESLGSSLEQALRTALGPNTYGIRMLV